MADSQNKTDAAAQNAYAEAAERKNDTAPKPAAAAEAAPAAAVSAKPAASLPAPRKPVSKIAKKAAAKKGATAKKSAQPAINKPAITSRAAETRALPRPKDTTMATVNDTTAKTTDFTNDVQGRLKAAYDKGTEMTAEATEFQKGNFEAMVESGRIFVEGVQGLGRTYVEDGKAAVETATADVKKMAAVKSPTELFQLQGEIARRNFDVAMATASKNAEAMMKLANEAFAPMSSRMSLAAEKISKAA